MMMMKKNLSSSITMMNQRYRSSASLSSMMILGTVLLLLLTTTIAPPRPSRTFSVVVEAAPSSSIPTPLPSSLAPPTAGENATIVVAEELDTEREQPEQRQQKEQRNSEEEGQQDHRQGQGQGEEKQKQQQQKQEQRKQKQTNNWHFWKNTRIRTSTKTRRKQQQHYGKTNSLDRHHNNMLWREIGRKGILRVMLWRVGVLVPWIRNAIFVIDLLFGLLLLPVLVSPPITQNQTMEDGGILSVNQTNDDPAVIQNLTIPVTDSDDDHPHIVSDKSNLLPDEREIGVQDSQEESSIVCAVEESLNTIDPPRICSSRDHVTGEEHDFDSSSFVAPASNVSYYQIHQLTNLLFDFYNDFLFLPINDIVTSSLTTTTFNVSSFYLVERDTVSNWTSHFWSNLTHGWTALVAQIKYPATSGVEVQLRNKNTTRPVPALVFKSLKHNLSKLRHGIVVLARSLGKRLNIGRRFTSRYLLTKWRQAKTMILKITLKVLSKATTGLERASIEAENKSKAMMTTTTNQQELYRKGAGIKEKSSMLKTSSSSSSLSSTPVESSKSKSKPVQAAASTKKKPSSVSNASNSKKTTTSKEKKQKKSTADSLSSKPSIMDQLTGALTAPKKRNSKQIQDVDPEPSLLADMFSSLASWGLYAAGGAAVAGYFAYSQYDFWFGSGSSSTSQSPVSSSSVETGTQATTTTDEIVNMEVDIVSNIASPDMTSRRSTRGMTTRRAAAVTPGSSLR